MPPKLTHARSIVLLAIAMLCFAPGCLLLGSPETKHPDNVFDQDQNQVDQDSGFDVDNDANDQDLDDPDCPGGNCPYRNEGDGEQREGFDDPDTQAVADRTGEALVAVRAGLSCDANACNTSRLHEKKTGTYSCMRCRQPTVGDGWHNLVTDEGDSALFLCQQCWDKSSTSERRGYLNVYLQTIKLTDTQIAARFKSSIE